MLQASSSEDAGDNDEDEQPPLDAILSFCVNPHKGELVTSSRSLLLRQWALDLAESPTGPRVRCTRALKGHTEPTLALDYDPSGTLVASGSSDRTARVFDTRGGFATHNFKHPSTVTLVKFHPDARRLVLVTCADDLNVRLWSLHDKACVATLGNHLSAVTAISFTHDGDTMATGSRDKVVNFWELKQNTLLKTFAVYEEVEGLCILDGDEVESEGVALSEKKRKRAPAADATGVLVVVGSKGSARAWNFAPKDSSTLAEASRKGGRDDLLTCTPRVTEPPRPGAVVPYLTLLPVAGSEGYLLAATAEHNIRFLNRRTLVPFRDLVGFNDEILAAKYVPGATEQVVMATNSPHVKMLRLADFSCTVLDGHSGTVLTLDVCPEGAWVVTGSKDRTCRLWHAATGTCVMTCVGHTQAVAAVALSRRKAPYTTPSSSGNSSTSNAFFFSASSDRTLKKWRLESGALRSFAASPPSTPQTPTSERNVRAHEKDINHLIVSPNDGLVASSSQDKTVRLWHCSDLALAGTLKGHKRGVMALAFSPTTKSAATASGDRTVKVWSLTDFSCLSTFQGHAGSVLTIDFLSGGTQLVSTGADGLLKVWTLKTSECETTLDAHTDKVWALSVRGDGAELVTGGADSVLNVWRDVTGAADEAEVLAAEQGVLKEQDLMSAMSRKDFSHAVDLAFELGHSYRLWTVLKDLLESGGSFDALVVAWDDARLAQVLNFLRDWNTNATKAGVAQALLASVLRKVPLQRLKGVPGAGALVDGLASYTERHFARVDKVVQASFLIDYTCAAMSAIGATPKEA